jgi:hypothetical protein
MGGLEVIGHEDGLNFLADDPRCIQMGRNERASKWPSVQQFSF